MSITTANTTAPALPADLEALMRQLKMPHARTIAPDVRATARAQRWEPAEVIKALLAEETKGRARSMLATRRKAAGFPTGKTFAGDTPRWFADTAKTRALGFMPTVPLHEGLRRTIAWMREAAPVAAV